MADVSFRQMTDYADGTPGATDRLLFETAGFVPRGCAPSSIVIPISSVTSLQAALDLKATLASPTFSGTVTLGGSLDGNGNSIIDYIQPFVSGAFTSLTQTAHGGRAILITGAGTVTVPVINGFICLIWNKSGANRTIQPASGSLIHDGATIASIALPNNRSVTVHGDGTDVWVDGALA